MWILVVAVLELHLFLAIYDSSDPVVRREHSSLLVNQLAEESTIYLPSACRHSANQQPALATSHFPIISVFRTSKTPALIPKTISALADATLI